MFRDPFHPYNNGSKKDLMGPAFLVLFLIILASVLGAPR